MKKLFTFFMMATFTSISFNLSAEAVLSTFPYTSNFTENFTNVSQLPAWMTCPNGVTNLTGTMVDLEGVNVSSEPDYAGGYLKTNKLELSLQSCQNLTFKWCSNGGRKPLVTDDQGNELLSYAANRTSKNLYTESIDVNSSSPVTLTIAFYNNASASTAGIYYIKITGLAEGELITTVLDAALISAKGKVAGAVVGIAPQNFPQSAVDALNAAVSAAEGVIITATLQSEITAAIASLNAAITAFDASRITYFVPEADKVYTISSLGRPNGTGISGTKYLYASSSDTKVIWTETITVEENAQWEVIASESDANLLTLKNVGTGKIMQTDGVLSDDAYEYYVSFRSAATSSVTKTVFSIEGADRSRALEVYNAEGGIRFGTGYAARDRFQWSFDAVETATGIDNSLENSKTPVSTEYFDLTGKKVQKDTKGFCIERTTFDDGSIESKKMLVY